MKKLIIITAMAIMALSTASAQYRSEVYTGRETNRWEDSRNGGHSKERWGYDRNYNRVNGTASSINSFQKEARVKIADGIINGLINSSEAKRLLELAEAIELKENKYMRNGRLTSREVADLKGDLYRLNKLINHEMGDNDRGNVDYHHRDRRF